jgi:hypothetical protein
MVYIKKNSYLFLVLFGMALLPNCAKYQPKPFGIVTGGIFSSSSNKNTQNQEFNIQAEVLSQKMSQYIFDKDPIKKGYVPLLISIRNNTDKTYLLRGENISLNMENKKSVAKSLHFNTLKRVALWSIGIFCCIGLFAIPTIVDGIKSKNANDHIDRDFDERLLDSSTLLFIQPHSTLTKAIFLTHKNILNDFNLALEETETRSIKTFSVKLTNQSM